MPLMLAWHMCIELADAVETIMSFFRVMLCQYTASMIYSITRVYVGTSKSHLDAPDLSEFCEYLSTKYCAVVSKQFNLQSSFEEYVF